MAILACIPCLAHAQTAKPARPGRPARPAYTLERYDESWSFLRDRSQRKDFFDPIKWIPIGRDSTRYITLGGELRERFQDTRNAGFGIPSPSRNSDAYHRAYVFADLHLGPRFRTFAEVVNGETRGTTKKPSSFEEDPLDLLQAFVDVGIPAAKSGDVTLRVGREDMMFGSSRLVSLREAPNVRRTFDGARAFWTPAKGKRIDAFVTRPVAPQVNVFDDHADRTQLFWGLYSTTPVAANGSSLDLYYLGLDRKDAPFAQGIARERRHTVGARVFGKQTGFDLDEEQFNFDSRDPPDAVTQFDWDAEAAYQFGSFGSATIGAWMISSNWGYTFFDAPLAPRLGLKADVASGDANSKDNRLGTFNPLYPALRYYSLVRLLEPANLENVQPSITLSLVKDLAATVSWSASWRTTSADAFYAPPLVPVKGTIPGGRSIGRQASAILAWKANAHLILSANYAHFTPAGSVRQAGGRAGDFVLALSQFKF